jgi:hypothetical protein
MVLDRLPDDLKILVFSHLHVSQLWGRKYKAHLARVILCCRHYYNLAIPILYSSLNGESKARSLGFLRTILKRPDLALYVQYLEGFDPGEDRSPQYDLIIPQRRRHLDPRGRRLLEPKLEGLTTVLEKGCDDEDLRYRWHQSFSYQQCLQDGEWIDMPGNWDSIAALLILLLPNLSTLDIPLYSEEPSQTQARAEFIPFVFGQALQLQTSSIHSTYPFRPLSNLRKLEISVDEHYAVSFDSILPFLQLKSIRHVTYPVSLTNTGCDDAMNDDDIKQPIFHITHLSFPQSDIHSRSLAKFLRNFRGLTQFSYVHSAEHWAEGEESYPFIPSEIRRGLLHSKDSLQELTLVNDLEDYQQADEYDENGNSEHTPENIPVLPLGSLLEFRHLRRLHASVIALVGRVVTGTKVGGTKSADIDPPPTHEQNIRFVESLPDSLEELTLRACFHDIYTLMEVLFERRRQGGVKVLNKVELYFQKDFSEEQILTDEEGIHCELEGSYVGIQVTRHTVEWFH